MKRTQPLWVVAVALAAGTGLLAGCASEPPEPPETPEPEAAPINDGFDDCNQWLIDQREARRAANPEIAFYAQAILDSSDKLDRAREIRSEEAVLRHAREIGEYAFELGSTYIDYAVVVSAIGAPSGMSTSADRYVRLTRELGENYRALNATGLGPDAAPIWDELGRLHDERDYVLETLSRCN